MIIGVFCIVKGKVIIGNGGGEFGVCGFVVVYDVEIGEQVWKFYIVLGNLDNGFENEVIEMVVEIWIGEWWKLGGGGIVWDSMVFDFELDFFYIGVGNGLFWNQKV